MNLYEHTIIARQDTSPTAIYLNRKGEVVKIHTGFYGPGTGEMYEKFSRETEAFVSALLEE